jgi:hypothetical protein
LSRTEGMPRASSNSIVSLGLSGPDTQSPRLMMELGPDGRLCRFRKPYAPCPSKLSPVYKQAVGVSVRERSPHAARPGNHIQQATRRSILPTKNSFEFIPKPG